LAFLEYLERLKREEKEEAAGKGSESGDGEESRLLKAEKEVIVVMRMLQRLGG